MERKTFITSAGALGAGGLLSFLRPPATRGAWSAGGELPQQNRSGNGAGTRGRDAKPLGTLSDDLTPYTEVWDDAHLRHLLRRTMFGVPESQFLDAQKIGPFGAVATVPMGAVVAQLLACQDTTKFPVPTPFATWLNDYPILAGSTTDMMNAVTLEANKIQQIENWWFDQIAQENLSIRQKMTLLWTNHFVTGSQDILIAAYVYTYLNTCMTNALGNFRDFALAISSDPSMLIYLNGNENYVAGGKNSINENYARELMELFTLGLNDPKTGKPNYTETDVQNSARSLTGWQPAPYDQIINQKIVPPFAGVLVDGSVSGDPNLHDDGMKAFLGQTGNFGLQDIIKIIFEQGSPSGYTSAYWVCQKIYQEFVYYIPNTSVVDAMATVMLKNNFEIAPVMQALLSSAHFYDASVVGAQIKSPLQYMGSLVREFALTYPPFDPSQPPVVSTTNDLITYGDTNPTLSIITYICNLQGQWILNPPNVKGWPGGENWLNAGTFANREEYSTGILYNYLVNPTNKWGLSFNQDTYAGQITNAGSLTSGALTQALEDLSLAFTLGPLESNSLDPNPALSQDVIDTTIQPFANAMTQLPEFQLF